MVQPISAVVVNFWELPRAEVSTQFARSLLDGFVARELEATRLKRKEIIPDSVNPKRKASEYSEEDTHRLG